MLSTDTSPTTATATPPFSAKLVITCGRSSRSSRRRMLLTGTNAISPPLTASKAGGRVRSAQAHSTRRSSPAPPARSSVPSGSTLRQMSLTVTAGALTLEPLEILLEFPRSHLAAILAPLQTFRFDERLGEVIAQRVDDHGVSFECVGGVAQVVGQNADVATLQLHVVEAIQRFFDGLGKGQSALDAIEPASQHHRERQVRVA